MESGQNRERILLIFSIILLVNIFARLVPSVVLAVLILLLQLIMLRKQEIVFANIFINGFIFGLLFIYYGYEGSGGLFLVVGATYGLALWRKMFFGKSAAIYILITLSLSVITMFSSGYFINAKLLNIFSTGLFSFIGFSIWLKYRDNFNAELISWFFLLAGFFLLNIAFDFTQFPGPKVFLDLDWLREQTYAYGDNNYRDVDEFAVGYHAPGFFATLGLVFQGINGRRNVSISSLLFIVLSLLVCLYSGARQNVVAWFATFAFLYLNLRLVIILGVSLLLLISILNIDIFMLLSDNYQLLLQAESIIGFVEASGRWIHTQQALEYFMSSPITGIGVGFYNYGGKALWAHNLFLEVLAETGIIGFAIIVLVPFALFVVRIKSEGERRYLVVFIPYFVRAFVSESLVLNIALIVLVIVYSNSLGWKGRIIP